MSRRTRRKPDLAGFASVQVPAILDGRQSSLAESSNVQNWQNKVVVITGGSSGFGLALARQWGRSGARLALLARDVERLQQAREQLSRVTGSDVQVHSVDLTDSAATARVINEVADCCGGIDVLVNCAGASTRHALETTAPKLFRDQMECNFFTAVNCTQSALPHLLRNRGQIILIASLAGRTAWPLVGAYVTSKSALVAYGAQLRLELGERLRVLTVLPGPIHRDDQDERYQREAAGLPEQARRPGAGAPVRGLDPEQLAVELLRAAARGDRELIRPWKAGLLFKLQGLSPRLGDWLLRRLSR